MGTSGMFHRRETEGAAAISGLWESVAEPQTAASSQGFGTNGNVLRARENAGIPLFHSVVSSRGATAFSGISGIVARVKAGFGKVCRK
jgi:hypothetical protein